MTETRYVAQGHLCGCTAAAVAMVVGKTYEEVQRTTVVDFNIEGAQIEDWLDFLFDHGFTFHRMYRVTQLQGRNKQRGTWPPEPFAPIHICSVTTVKGAHAVVMLENGDILDPAWTGLHKLSDYIAVQIVYGLFVAGPTDLPSRDEKKEE